MVKKISRRRFRTGKMMYRMEKIMKRLLCSAAILIGTAAFADEVQPAIGWDFDKLEEGQTISADGKYRALVTRSENVAAVPGKSGSAVSIRGKYKGNQAGALAVKNFPFDFSKLFTVEVLVKFFGGISRKAKREIFSIADAERGPGIRFYLYSGALIFSTGNGKKEYMVKSDSNSLNITPDAWHLLTVTYDGKKISLYFDGVRAAEKEIEIIPAKKVKVLSIGSYKNGLAYPLHGALDELKFYGFCKTPAEAAECYISFFGE